MHREKPQPKDIFELPDFRGLLIADHKEALGKKGGEMQETLNEASCN
jgi:hypothetical protein